MLEDEQGFLYPKVNLELCVNCGLCECVCPVINQAESCKPLKVYAAKNADDKVRLASSSGGVFFALAEKVIGQGGVVFGARFNEKWEVVHGYAETIEEVKSFQGSKYVQSRIGDTYRQAETFLKAGRKVMFTGTPCQLAGLRLFLRKDYGEQLLSVDLVCHGVPSPLVWREYLEYITRPAGASDGKNTVSRSLNKPPVITGISFRDKRLGWQKFGFSVRVSATSGSGQNSVFQSGKHQLEDKELLFEPLDKNIFMQVFLNNLDLRPSCYACPAKCGKSGSDISLADFWGIDSVIPQKDNDKGISLVLIHTMNGQKHFDSAEISCKQTDYGDAFRGNSSIENSVAVPRYYTMFWQEYNIFGIPGAARAIKCARPSLLKRSIRCISANMPSELKRILKRLMK